MQVPAPGHGGSGTRTRPEAFEWRHSTGAAVRRTGHRSGYKLVRMATDAGVGGGDVATGGGEVVAVFTMHMKWSDWDQIGTFMFQGSGAQGILGEAWQLVAVMTALGIWYRWHDDSHT